LLNGIGKFDERFFMYFEDLDLCRRIGKLKQGRLFFGSGIGPLPPEVVGRTQWNPWDFYQGWTHSSNLWGKVFF
jgi:hypothetical protein